MSSWALSPYGLGADSIAQDSLLMQQYANALSNYSANQTSTSGSNSATNKTTTNSNNVSFSGIARAAEPVESGSSWVAPTITIAGITATAAGFLLSRGKGQGAKNVLEQIKLGWQSFGKNAKSEKLQVLKQDGRTLVTVPNATNKIQGSATSMKQELEAIGLKDGEKAGLSVLTATKDGKTVLADGVRIRSGKYTLSNGNTVTFKNGKVTKYTDKNGNDILIRYTEPGKVAKYKGVNEANKKEIDDMLAGLSKGEKLGEISNLEVVINQNGILRKMTNTTAGSDLNLNYALSKKFDLQNKQVQAYRKNNKDIDEFLTQIEKGKTGVGKIVGAEYTTKMHDGQKYRFVLENNTIKCVRDASGRKLSPVEQDALEYNNRKAFEEVFKNEKKFENIIRVAA